MKNYYYRINIVDGTSSSYPDIYQSFRRNTLKRAKDKIKQLEAELSPMEDIKLIKYNSKGTGKEVGY